MEQDYPIKHFKMMADVAAQLASLPALILQHSYSYESFGSWWFTFKRSGRQFRIVFDGRDEYLSLQDAVADFRELEGRQLQKPTPDILVAESVSLITQKT